MAEYDTETGETTYPKGETDDAREAREKRERAGVGQPAEAEGEGKDERQSQKDRKTAEHKSGD